MRTSPPRASHSTFDRIGIEFLRSTIPCTSESSVARSLRLTRISMDFLFFYLSIEKRDYLRSDEAA